jgi:hypothetical protein
MESSGEYMVLYGSAMGFYVFSWIFKGVFVVGRPFVATV